ncbi:MAG: rhodanese-like domain-containing protein, partial [Calditrichota bacterium]
VGVSVVKVYDLYVGSVGLTAAESIEKGLNVGEIWGTFHDRMFYYPEATPLNAKLIYDQNTGEILGLQVVSRGPILQILNSAAVLMQNHVALDTLNSLEHAYAPPYAQPLSPLHYLSFIAENSRSAGVELVGPGEFKNIPQETIILDVRTSEERTAFPLPDNLSNEIIPIPVEQLRSRLAELPSGRPMVTVCQMGSRAWDAALILRRAGWNDVGILAGGVLFLAPERIRKTASNIKI